MQYLLLQQQLELLKIEQRARAHTHAQPHSPNSHHPHRST
jgi:hypothetical protein